MTRPVIVREERPDDVPAVRAVQLSAFETPAEADLVDALRQGAEHYVSLVAETDGEIVGHIAFTEMTLEPAREGLALGLSPLAVAPGRQRQGVGSALVEAGLERCRSLGAALVIVLGGPDYYARFGFEPASSLGLRSTWGVPDEVFMALALGPAPEGPDALARFRPEFDGLE